MRILDILTLHDQLSLQDLSEWIDRGWVRPEQDETDYAFSDVDVARVRLVYDLRIRMSFDDDATAVILSLLDEVHTLRDRLDAVGAVVDDQPDEVRQALIDALAARYSRSPRGEE